jgi:hypothetical protein
MSAERLMPTDEAADLIELTRTIAGNEMRGSDDETERTETSAATSTADPTTRSE